MKQLVICGWNVGLDKILLTKTLRTEFGYSLSEGKSITDRVLANEEIRIPFDNATSTEEDLVKSLQKIGARASIENSIPSSQR
ncbi:MAG: hypothetical protein ABR907_12365 [Terracidiphilus sp.]|jgi:hypothetical protein